MFLEYGVNQSERYIHISQVNSGRVTLSCPYCGQSLIARKGNKKEHHFAHDGTTCRWSDRDIDALSVPMFDRFHTFLEGKLWKQLQGFKHGQDANMRILSERELVYVSHIGQASGYQLTDLGKIPFGFATLSTFADFQLSKIVDRHYVLSETIRLAKFGLPYSYDTSTYQVEPNPEMIMPALTDLQIYRTQLTRVFNLDLYLLEIKHSDGVLYKIGVSADVDRRMIEIKRDLASLSIKQIQPIQLLKRRGAVERYAQYRYREHQKKMGAHTEYFEFDDETKLKVLADLAQLGNFQPADKDDNRYISSYGNNPSRMLTRRGLVTTIIDNEPPEIEIIIKDSIKGENIRNDPIEGMQETTGTDAGRSSDDDDVFAKYPNVVTCLKKGDSLWVTARKCRVSINTVRKVNDILTR
jgi:hypothetical protein